jgi:hypothetical protein
MVGVDGVAQEVEIYELCHTMVGVDGVAQEVEIYELCHTMVGVDGVAQEVEVGSAHEERLHCQARLLFKHTLPLRNNRSKQTKTRRVITCTRDEEIRGISIAQSLHKTAQALHKTAQSLHKTALHKTAQSFHKTAQSLHTTA